MGVLSSSIIANMVGQGWGVLLSLVAIPFYVRFLGVEAYGLIGFYAMLQAVLQVLDCGLSPTMNREMARYSAFPERGGEARDLVRTMEVGYWAVGVLIGGAIFLGAPFVAKSWVNAGSIPIQEIERVVRMMGILAALQWPLSFYGSGLLGLQKQVLLNSVNVPLATINTGGAVLILWLASSKIVAFFVWQILVGGVQVGVITILLWRSLPGAGHPGRVDLALLRSRWRFAVGMGGITLSSIVLAQIDKVILSRMLSLEMFGYYTLAGTVGRSLYILITPVFNAVFPRLSALVATHDTVALKNLYHQASQFMAVLVVPLAGVIAAFSEDILRIWLASESAARVAAPIASILVLGTAMNGLMNLPYGLQLAYGWTNLALAINTVFVVTVVPGVMVLTALYGAVGGAIMWLVLNFTYLIIGVPLTHRRLLRGETRRWYIEDVGFPSVAAVLVILFGMLMLKRPLPSSVLVVGIGVTLVASAAAALSAASRIRGLPGTYLSRWMPS
jgi:O-antigen/teichoic acid export membrane protein